MKAFHKEKATSIPLYSQHLLNHCFSIFSSTVQRQHAGRDLCQWNTLLFMWAEGLWFGAYFLVPQFCYSWAAGLGPVPQPLWASMALAISALEKTPLLVRAAAFWHWLGYWWGESQGIHGKEKEGTNEEGLYPSQGVWFSPWGQWGTSDSLRIYFTVSDSQKRSGRHSDQGLWIRTQQGSECPWMRGQRVRKWTDSIPTDGETEAHSVYVTSPGRLSRWEVGAQIPCFSALWPTWPRLPAPKDRRTPLSCPRACGLCFS